MIPPLFDMEAPTGRRPLGEFIAVVLCVLWAFPPGFGMIDLDAALPPGDPAFREHWFLEGSRGALVTTLLVFPLLVAAVRPAIASNIARHQTVLVGCFVVAAALCKGGEFMILSLGSGVSTLARWLPLRRVAHSPQRSKRIARWWPPFLIAAGYLGLPLLLFGPDAFTVKTVGILAAVAAMVTWLARSPRRLGNAATATPPARLALPFAVLVALGPGWRTRCTWRRSLAPA